MLIWYTLLNADHAGSPMGGPLGHAMGPMPPHPLATHHGMEPMPDHGPHAMGPMPDHGPHGAPHGGPHGGPHGSPHGSPHDGPHGGPDDGPQAGMGGPQSDDAMMPMPAEGPDVDGPHPDTDATQPEGRHLLELYMLDVHSW